MRPWLNIGIAVLIGAATYAATLYIDHFSRPEIHQVPSSYETTGFATDARAPDFSFQSAQGNTLSLSDFKGRIVLVNFWASWCAPCIVEFPALLQLAQQNEEKLALIALSTDTTREAMDLFVEKLERQNLQLQARNIFISYDENGKITQGLFNITRLPETLIIGPDGRIKRQLIGANWDVEEVQHYIQALY